MRSPRFTKLITIPTFRNGRWGFNKYDCSLIGIKEVNHKDGVKEDNRFVALEWMTKKENQQHAVATGLQSSGHIKEGTVALLGRIVMEGQYKGLEFVMPGVVAFEKVNVSRHTAVRCANGDFRSIQGCEWFEIERDELENYPEGFPAGFLEYYKENQRLADPKVKPVVATIVLGPHAGEKFSLFGATEISANGYGPGYVREAARKSKIHKGCTWEETTIEEAFQYVRGISREKYATIK